MHNRTTLPRTDKQALERKQAVQGKCQAHLTFLEPEHLRTPLLCLAMRRLLATLKLAHQTIPTRVRAMAVSAIGYAGVCLVLSNRKNFSCVFDIKLTFSAVNQKRIDCDGRETRCSVCDTVTLDLVASKNPIIVVVTKDVRRLSFRILTLALWCLFFLSSFGPLEGPLVS
jgi:hypothetical protein